MPYCQICTDDGTQTGCTVGTFSLVNCVGPILHPRLPSYEVTKSIYDDTDATDKCITLLRLPAYICHQFVMRRLSTFTRTRRLSLL